MISNIVTPIILATCVRHLSQLLLCICFISLCWVVFVKSISAFGRGLWRVSIFFYKTFHQSSCLPAMSATNSQYFHQHGCFKDTAELKQIIRETKVIMLMSLFPVPLEWVFLQFDYSNDFSTKNSCSTTSTHFLTFGNSAIVSMNFLPIPMDYYAKL